MATTNTARTKSNRAKWAALREVVGTVVVKSVWNEHLSDFATFKSEAMPATASAATPKSRKAGKGSTAQRSPRLRKADYLGGALLAFRELTHKQRARHVEAYRALAAIQPGDAPASPTVEPSNVEPSASANASTPRDEQQAAPAHEAPAFDFDFNSLKANTAGEPA